MNQLKVLSLTAILLLGPSIRQAEGSLPHIPTAFSEDGRFLLIQMDNLVLWDLGSKALVAKVPLASCHQVALLKQDGWVLCVKHDVVVYDWKNRESVATVPQESRRPYTLLAYSKETDRMVLRHGHDAVSVWRIGKKLIPLKHIPLGAKTETQSVAASSDTTLLAVAQGGTIRLHDLTGTTIRDMSIKGGKPLDLLFAPDRSTLAATLGNTVLFIDTVEASIRGRATLTTTVGGGSWPLTPRRFSRDGHRLVAGNGEKSYALFDTDTGKSVSLTQLINPDQERGGPSPTDLAAVDISDDGEYLVRQSAQLGTVQIWDLRTGVMLPDLCGHDCRNMDPRISLLRWSPTGSKIVVGLKGGLSPDVDGNISVWDVETRSPELVLDSTHSQAKVLVKRPAPPVTDVGLSAKPIASSPPEAVPAFVHARALRALVTSPSANLLVTSGDDGLLKVWEPGQGILLRQLALSAPASALAFSADGALLAAGTTHGEIRLWDAQSWKEFPSYPSGQGQINALQFLSGNRFLVIAGKQPRVLVLDLLVRTVIRELVHAGYSLTCDPKGCLRKRAPEGDVVETLSLLDGSPFLLTASRTGRAVWDILTWKPVEEPVGLPTVWSGLGWNRPFVATTRARDPNAFTLAVWDTTRNKVMASLDTFSKRDTEAIENGSTVALGASMAVDPLHRWVATRVGEHLAVWDLSAQAKKKTFHVKALYHLHWTSDGKYLIVGTLDRKVLVWSVETMEPAHYLRDPSVTG
jgi:WD40 repeat protein